MSRQQLNVAIPMLYAIIVVAVALTYSRALTVVAVVGAMLVGLYFAAFARGGDGGRNRLRNRNRGR